VLRPARWRLYWQLVGRWVLAAGALFLVLGLLGTALGFSPAVDWSLNIVGLLFAMESLVVGLLQLRQRPTTFSDGEFHFVADDDGLRVDGPFGTQTIKWRAYKKAFIDKRFLYLMVSPRSMQLIPLTRDLQPLIDHLESIGLRARRFNLFRP
jgi:hypothetical protein